MRQGILVALFGLALSGAALHAADRSVAVLDTNSPWRMYHSLQPPVIQLDQDLVYIETDLHWQNWTSPAPPSGWERPEFDDADWLRGGLKLSARTPYVSRLCLRNRFEVTDPAKAGNLSLTVVYRGGAVVYLNGQEVGRGNLAPGAELAEAYPRDVYLSDDDKLMGEGWWVKGDENLRRVAARNRTLEVELPGKVLRQGANVLALEIVRAPYDKVVDEKKAAKKIDAENFDRGTLYQIGWNTCEIRSVQLKAASAEGLVPAVARPEGLQLWNGDVMLMDHESDFGNPAEPLRPIKLWGPRNGRFSAKALVGSRQAIRGLKASVSDLEGPGKIPAGQVQIRYAASVGDRFDPERKAYYPRDLSLLNGLLEAPLDEFPAGKFGTVVPVWLTVKVPRDARPGAYVGQLKVEADGEKPLTVPVKLEVQEWVLPDPADFRTWVEIVESPETLAVEYNLPIWSERHWEMIDKSLEAISASGSRVVYVPLICHTNFGNAESMVRWIRRGENQYGYDFSAMERYLDLVQKHMGKPRFVVFTAWEVYLNTPRASVEVRGREGSYEFKESSAVAERFKLKGRGPAVTVLEPGTDTAEAFYLPRYEDPAAMALWQPLWQELHRRMKRRGWEDAAALGMLSDIWPTKEEIAALQELSGDLPWVMHTHGGSRVRAKIHGLAEIAYIAYVWNCRYYAETDKERPYGWKQPELYAQYVRFSTVNNYPGASLRSFAEMNITGYQRGVGRIGGEFWPVIKDTKGQRRYTLGDRYHESYWHSLNLSSYMLVPGPQGPVAASRYEIFCEGVQECEARIYIEQALSDEQLKARLGPELAREAQDYLDERSQYMWTGVRSHLLYGRNYASVSMASGCIGGLAGHVWFAGSGWQERSRKLYALAAEVQRSLEGK